MKKLLIATNNPAKFCEYQALLGDLPFVLTIPAQEGIELEVEESGCDFAENALLKARAYAQASGLLTLADDSGLEVDALGGEPGVRSHRYAGEEVGDAGLIAVLLKKMEGIPWERRTARFRCVIAIAAPDSTHVVEGTCEGIIAFEPRGQRGFGYDPVFYLPEFGQTMAELEPEIKNRISHRARAAQKAREILRAFA
jgi:XTP/dITP diphosphohydrolase